MCAQDNLSVHGDLMAPHAIDLHSMIVGLMARGSRCATDDQWSMARDYWSLLSHVTAMVFQSLFFTKILLVYGASSCPYPYLLFDGHWRNVLNVLFVRRQSLFLSLLIDDFQSAGFKF